MSETFPKSPRPTLRPTRYGVAFISIMFGIWFAAINYDNNLSYLFLFTLAAIGLISLFNARRNLQGISSHVLPIQPIFAKQPAALRLEIRHSQKNSLFDIRIRIANSVLTADEARIPLILPNQSHEASIPIITGRRGSFHISRLEISTTFPFGLCRAFFEIKVDCPILIYPQPIGIKPMPQSRPRLSGQLLPNVQPGDDFYGLRDYIPGESPRRIAWRVLARGRPLMSREFRNDEEGELVLDWSQLDRLDQEQRLSQLTSWILKAENSHQYYQIRIPGFESEIGLGSKHFHRCLAALAEFKGEIFK
jgi:uncharacterized protein (DUF58 family)